MLENSLYLFFVDIIQEGIFRRTGALTRQVQLKTCLNEGISVNFDDNNFSVHDCASVLKNFLSELPEPLVTDVYYPMYCQISGTFWRLIFCIYYRLCFIIFFFMFRMV